MFSKKKSYNNKIIMTHLSFKCVYKIALKRFKFKIIFTLNDFHWKTVYEYLRNSSRFYNILQILNNFLKIWVHSLK